MGSEILPVQRVFGLQRKYIENSIENVKKGLELHKKAMDTVDPGFPIEAYNGGIEAQKTILDTYFNVLEDITPEDIDIQNQRQLYDETYNVLQNQNQQATNTLQNSIKDVKKIYTDTLEQNIDVLDDQIEGILDGLDQLEDQTIQTVEQTKKEVEIEE